jgi:hypothetical protein
LLKSTASGWSAWYYLAPGRVATRGLIPIMTWPCFYDYTTRWDELAPLAELTSDILVDTGALISAKPFRAGDHQNDPGLMREIARDGLDL